MSSNNTPETPGTAQFPETPGVDGDMARAVSSANPLQQIHQVRVRAFSAPAVQDEMADDLSQPDALLVLKTNNGLGKPTQSCLEALDIQLPGNVKAQAGDLTYAGTFGGLSTLVAEMGSIGNARHLRDAFIKLTQNLTARGYNNVAIVFDDLGLDEADEASPNAVLWEMIYGTQMGAYFPSMKSGDGGKSKRLERVTFAIPRDVSWHGSLKERVADLTRLASNTALGSQYMRQLVQMPPNVMTTKALYRAALAIEKMCPAVKVSCEEVTDDAPFRLMRAVGRASNQPSFVITLRYEGDPDADLQALIGKGLVYDTGGINLKSNGGAGMKADMGGSAMVLGTMLAAALNKAEVNLVAVIGAVCNDIGPNAYRPDDVITAYNGKTVEIINTDAEGRLVMADCLSYAEEIFRPARIFSFATLTGAAAVFSGLRAPFFTDDEDLASKILQDAERAEEMVIHIPMDDYLKPTVESTIADLRNISSGRECGHTTAAIFLNHFVESTPYCHFDIAGACDINPERGGGAFGIPMMMAYFDVDIC